MAKTEFTLRSTTSDNIDFQFLQDSDNDGIAEAAINLTGIDHLDLILIDKGGTVTEFSSTASPAKVSITGSAAGSVRFAPGTADFLDSKSPYQGYWWVYVTSTRKYSVPEDSEMTFHIRGTS